MRFCRRLRGPRPHLPDHEIGHGDEFDDCGEGEGVEETRTRGSLGAGGSGEREGAQRDPRGPV